MKNYLLLTLSFCLLTTACGKNGAVSARKLDSIECTDDNCDGGTTFPVRVQKVEGIISQRQVMPNFQKCLGLPTVSAASTAAFKDSISNLSLDGMAKDMSAPMLMALTKVTSELCLDRINAEKNLPMRPFFKGFTLGGTVANTETFDLDKTLNTLGLSCWGRELTAFEMTTIKEQIGTRKDTTGALFACTAILSSVQAIRY